ncbi:hypothetical protein DOO78_10185 [Roseicella frigidaeris]|uniref:Uncharacterized protein n=1 Tax=Roseicella frigidaeris TaxID=2230885 RepID=A0A327M6I9_9PROT|nr:hypothetical protein DOO78_10185 [Roseicella frigidaeris]
MGEACTARDSASRDCATLMTDLSPRLDAAGPEAAGDWAGQALAGADEVGRTEPSSRRRPASVTMPGSRDGR